MKKLFSVTVEAGDARTCYRLSAYNHTEAGIKALAIMKRRGYAARLLSVEGAV